MKLLLVAALAAVGIASPNAYNADGDVNYTGIERNGIEVFLGIQYAQDTGGANRFKPPQPYTPASGSTVDATKAGEPCPQHLGQWFAPLTLLNVTSYSENCLNLNIARPKMNGTQSGQGLPVMFWIHGGSFWVGSNEEPTHGPDGLVLESIANGYPVIHVAINYRLGFFGFAQSDTLKTEGSENAGLRDQRFAIEWVRDNIHIFGGDPNKITIFGQSSGGLACGMQLLAYGGTKPLPYQQGICESQSLEPGITGNFTIDAMTRVVDYVGCNPNNGSVHTPEVVACLRGKDTETLFNASEATYSGDIAHNIGDIWLPVVDGDFLPDAPSKLIDEGRFGNATYMLGWTQGDVNFFTDVNIKTAEDTFNFVHGYLPALPVDLLTGEGGLLSFYPVSEFTPPPGTNLTAEFYRAARIFRDILMTCEPLYLAEAIHKKGNPVYLYDWNQTILEPILEAVFNISDFGVVHTSEFAYTYGNLSHYNVSDYPFNPTQSDYDLMHRGSRTWSLFASQGVTEVKTGDQWTNTLRGWKHGYWRLGDPDAPPRPGYTYVYTAGGPKEGLFALDGPDSTEEVRSQRLVERCGWINDPENIKYFQF